MTTAEKILLDVRTLLDELTKKGVLIPESTIADLIAKGIRLIDMAQKELYSVGNFYKKFEITQKNPDSLFGKFNGFEILEFKGTDIIKGDCAGRVYYFEADDEGQCIIEELDGGAWQTLATINITTSTGMNAYKGILTPTTSGNLLRMRFTGSTYYKIQNYAFYSEPFKTDRIPNYRPWIKYTMPSDFRLIDTVIEEFPVRQYTKSSSYKWEGFNELWVDYHFLGTLRVVYKPVPKTITDKADILEVDDITANAITYSVGAKLAMHDYPELTSYFEQKYNEILLKSMLKSPASEQAIIDVYGGNYGGI
jgi:hypothetical protein